MRCRDARRVTMAAVGLWLLLYAPTVGSGGVAEDADVAGTWDMTVESPQGSGHSTVVLRQDGSRLTGTYRGRIGESALEGIIHEDQIRFSVTLKFKDQPITVTYTGSVDRQTMRGTAQFGDYASADWSARRKP